jgi:hypothetical protein
MAEVNKSQAIRDYYKVNKKARTQEVIEALAKKGITVTPNLVTTVKSKHDKRRKAVRSVVAKGGVGIPEVKAALAFLKLTGTVAAAKQALAVAEDIKKIV